MIISNGLTDSLSARVGFNALHWVYCSIDPAGVSHRRLGIEHRAQHDGEEVYAMVPRLSTIVDKPCHLDIFVSGFCMIPRYGADRIIAHAKGKTRIIVKGSAKPMVRVWLECATWKVGLHG